MTVSGIGSNGLAAAATGIRAQLKAQTTAGVLEQAGLLSPELEKAFDGMEALGKSVTKAGIAHTIQETVGAMLDAIA